ncbi:helix-turn-helix domain-containing protein [Bacillus sp. JJ664]
MIEKIINLFGTNSVSVIPDENTYLDYTWFLTDHQELFGIKNESIQDEQRKLLSGIFTALDSEALFIPTINNGWFDYLFNDNPKNPFADENEAKLPSSVRFIHFNSKQFFSNKAEFEEAILAFFHKEIIIIWSSAREGVIIEKINDQPIMQSYLEHMQETIAADLYHDVTFLVGKCYAPLSELQQSFEIEQQCFRKALKLKKHKSVLWFSKEMLHYFMSFIPEDLRNVLPNILLNDMTLNDQTLSTVKIYLQHNMNVTATAKKAFLHRNTVQYRLDKFSEQTGIDLKHFEDGLVIFLAIQLLELREMS